MMAAKKTKSSTKTKFIKLKKKKSQNDTIEYCKVSGDFERKVLLLLEIYP